MPAESRAANAPEKAPKDEDADTQRDPAGSIRVGIGGWTFEPWRGTFYPDKLPKTRELSYAASRLTAIEINGTFYRAQSRKSFAKWREETPEGFVFALKGHRAIAMKRKLAETGESLAWFLDSGLAELGPKLGPILWQFAPSRAFDADDIAAFLKLLPREVEGLPLRHALEVRHQSFLCEAFLDLARRHGAAVVLADSPDYPALAADTADFAYWRLMRTQEEEESGYKPADLDVWAARARCWAAGRPTPDMPGLVEAAGPARAQDAGRDVFVFFIAGAKLRNPAAAKALMARLQD
ncbi:DUF72 domain-containing protein [Afifella pfennigii]|uniref:DUF72 domain-containing protein n=1 Tax=Afifella pfennigii TaxID=209897 RepID=UPI000478BF76|nr:DUF72 domain-containing protein [Afifella pfennigii]